jgi:hypothetical protein
MTLDLLDVMKIKKDIPIVLNSVGLMDDYEGDFSVRRFVTHTLDFTIKADLYGPITESGVILRTDTDVHTFAEHVYPLWDYHALTSLPGDLTSMADMNSCL